jgi:hypothetical protein
VAVLLPLGFYLAWNWAPVRSTPPAALPPADAYPISPRTFAADTLARKPETPGIITHVQITDLDGDGRADVLCCDAQQARVLWRRRSLAGEWEEVILNRDRLLAAPARTTVVDLDEDGDLDVLVAVLGSYMPTDEHVGKAAWLENDGQGKFTTHILLENVGRVTDIQPGDLDQDGDLDLAVAVFGHYRGEALWMERDDQGRFEQHSLLSLPGAIHMPVSDIDQDGDLDLAVLVSQNEESVMAFENQGEGVFQRRELFDTPNFDFGSAGLFPCDLDQDGRGDFLLVAGDNFELQVNHPQPWHGCLWLRSQGGWDFQVRQLATLGGTYAAATGDIDQDGDQDVVLASMFNHWRRPGAASLVWLENDGAQVFRTWRIADEPIQLATVDCGDLDGDGWPDIVAGSFHIIAPFDRIGRVTTWRNAGAALAKEVRP